MIFPQMINRVPYRQLAGILAAAFVAGSSSAAYGQDIENLGGDLSSDNPRTVVMQLPAPNVSSQERFNFHLDGHTTFHISFDLPDAQGKVPLGPFFNHNSCGACHVNDGRGPISISSRPPGSAVLVKVSLKGLNPDGSPKDVPGVGEQLQNHTVKGKTRFGLKLKWLTVKGKYPDGTRYTLRKPDLSFKVPGINSRKIVSSIRMTPPVIGQGLIEAIPDETLTALSDPTDANGDGISGKVNLVPNRETNGMSIGRFGFRASHPTVRQQSAAAFFHDMGVTNDLFSEAGAAPELSTLDLDRIEFYLQAAGVPKAQIQTDSDVVAGKGIFQRIGCDKCHVMTIKSGPSDVPEVANQTFHPMSDFLLHDMGKGLADKRPEFQATGSEWKTTPLWGLGLFEVLSTSKPGFLHDGRARTIEEAILWHGGEAAASQSMFKALPKVEREQLIKFLRSL